LLFLQNGGYGLWAGTLNVTAIEVGSGADLYVGDGQVVHSEMCTLSGGGLSVYGPPQQLGPLQVLTNGSLYVGSFSNSYPAQFSSVD